MCKTTFTKNLKPRPKPTQVCNWQWLKNHLNCRIYFFNPNYLLYSIPELSEKIAKREERLKKKEKLLEEELKAHEELKTEVKSLQTLNKRLETTLSKKEKQCNEANEKLNTFKQIQAQIFSLSKTVSDNGEDE